MIVRAITNVLYDSWPMLTIFVVVLSSVRLLHMIDNNEKIVFYEEFLNLLFLLYALIIYRLLTNTEGATSGINLIPFKEILRYDLHSELFYYNVIGNIVLFIPFGFFVSRYVNAKKASHILITSAIISLTIEIVQYKIGRAFDIDDVLLNVVGSIFGFLIFIAFSAIKNHLPKFLKRDAFYNFICIIIIIVIIFYLSRILDWGAVL